jgi:hypothetical protein
MVPLLTGCNPKEEPSSPPPIVVEKKSESVLSRPRVYPDCEDTLKVPCVTFDEGKWRKVTDYTPYRSKVIKRPTKVKGGWRVR